MGRSSNKHGAGKATGPAQAGGFTLVELMVTVAVLAVTLAIAIPSFRGITNQNRLVAATNEVVTALQVARMEAIRRNQRVAVCPSTDGATCSGADWSRVIVYVASDNEVVNDISPARGGITMQGSSNVTSNNVISFGAGGLATVGSGTARQGTIRLCATALPVTENSRDVQVVVSRISVSTQNGGASCAQPGN